MRGILQWGFTVLCLLLLLWFSSPVFAQYADCTEAHVINETDCQTTCAPYSTYQHIDYYNPVTKVFCYSSTSVCTYRTDCAGNPCSASNNCRWVLPQGGADCQGGSCGCGELRYSIQECQDTLGNWVHCQDACTADGSCNAGGCGNISPPPPGSSPTPIPIGTIIARAVPVTPSDTTCATVKAVPTASGQIDGTVHQFTASSTGNPPAQTQSGANYVTFTNISTGPYTIDPQLPSANWVLARACWTNDTTGVTGEGLSATFSNGETLRWDIGYRYGTAWVQTQGGDVYASGTLRSYLPAVTPRVFNADGPPAGGGYPGVVTYGTSYDFDSATLSQGSTLVSSTNWLVNDTRATVNYYDLFYHRFGSPTTADYTNPDLGAPAPPVLVGQPASRMSPYYALGNMETSGNWSVGSGQNIVFIVNGNLTIGGRINITGTGFVGFIVNGNITVSDTVGTTASSTTSVVDGVYIVSPTGTFRTGASMAAATAKFVGRGMFIAGNFLLERDLDAYGANTTDAAELFVYDPRLLLTMPDLMKELPVVWQEVAP